MRIGSERQSTCMLHREAGRAYTQLVPRGYQRCNCAAGLAPGVANRGRFLPVYGHLSVQVNTMPTNGLKTQGTAFNEPSGSALASPFGEFFNWPGGPINIETPASSVTPLPRLV